MMKKSLLMLFFIAVSTALSSQTILFDASTHEMAGNADWVIDADAWTNNMPAYPCTGNTNESLPGRYPTPAQSGITSSTPETYWTGGISSWAIDIVKTWGWTVHQYNSTQSYTFLTGTAIPFNGYLVLGRNVTEAQFRTAWPSMPGEAVYVNSGEKCPIVNGAETFDIYDDTPSILDGITIAMATGNAYQRKNPGDSPSLSGSWTTVAMANATPGMGAGTLSGAGVVINEMSDATTFSYEFLEFFYDGGAGSTELGVIGPTVFVTPGSSADSISWGIAPGAIEYHLYIGTTADFMTTPPSPVSWTVNSYLDSTDPMTNPDTRCVYFKILAFDGTNESNDL